MPTGFHTGASPANTYILPAADAPEISSAGSGNGASFTHVPWARAADVAQMTPTIPATNQPSCLTNRGIAFLLPESEPDHGNSTGMPRFRHIGTIDHRWEATITAAIPVRAASIHQMTFTAN